jgi:hypothetical protein
MRTKVKGCDMVMVRLRCLEIASTHFDSPKEALSRARAYESFVIGGAEGRALRVARLNVPAKRRR